MEANELISTVVAGGVGVILVIMGIVLLTGHGYMMIAGYNTMSEEERRKVNIKEVARVVGVFLIAAGVVVGLTLAGEIWGFPMPRWIVIGFLPVGAIAMVVYVNIGRRFKSPNDDDFGEKR